MTDKAVILIDGGYFDKLDDYAKAEYGNDIDFRTFSEKLCEYFNLEHLRTNYYNAFPYQDDQPSDHQKRYYSSRKSFYDAIDNKHKHQFEERGRVREEKIECNECGDTFIDRSQKGVDVGIAVDLVHMAHQDTAEVFIIVCGDEDLTHAVEKAKEQLCNVYVAYVHEPKHDIKVSDQLTTEADTAVNLRRDDFLKNCLRD